jgi:pilus assembly protein CpaB
MSRAARRRRGVVLILLAVACGGLAASEVQRHERRVEASVGEPVPVVVAGSDLAPGSPVAPGALALRRVPARFVPPDAVSAPEEVVGSRLAVPVAAGGYVTAGAIEGEGSGAGGGRPGAGQRAVDVAVAAGPDLFDAGPGARVDVLVTTESAEGSGRSYLALEDVEVLGVREAGPGPDGSGAAAGGAAGRAGAVATLRVTLRQAVLLTAAQSFAREIRLLLRPPGERRAGRPVVVEAAGL